MNKKHILLIAGIIMISVTSQAQIMFGGGFGGGYYPRPHRPQRNNPNLPEFEPSLNFSIGYGFPNLDANLLPDYYRYYKGNPTYGGPINAALDYRFSRNASIGLLVTSGHSKVRYYDYSNDAPAMTGSLNTWSFMVNFVRYMPVSKVVTPYIRTAIGISSYTQNFTDTTGGKIASPPLPSILAYQLSFGAQFNIDKRFGLFAEAGYGKYIVNAGLKFKL